MHLISDGVEVENIALFGSILNGDSNPESDIDLIIVSKDFIEKDIFERAKLTMRAEIKLMKQFIVPMDILNFTPDEYLEVVSSGLYPTKIVA